MDCAVYERGNRLPGPVNLDHVLDRVGHSENRFVWIGLYQPDAQQFERIADAFQLHPLAVEDAVHAHQRPKLERYGDTLFLVLKSIVYLDHDRLTASSDIVDTGEVMVFAGPRFAIVVRHGSAPALGGVRAQLEATPDKLAHGPAVPTMIVGVYGMNSGSMPELHWRYGYPAVLLIMVTLVAAIYRALRRNKWL